MKAILDHVGIAVKDLEASLSFFRDALGLHVEPRGRRPVAARPRAVCVDRTVVARASAGNRAGFADCKVSREAGSGTASHHAKGRRHSCGAGPIAAAQRPSHRRRYRGPGPRARPSRSSTRRARRVCSWSSNRSRPSDPRRRWRPARAAENHPPRRHRHRHRLGRLLLSRWRRDVRRRAEDLLGEESAARRAQPHSHGDALHTAARREDDAHRRGLRRQDDARSRRRFIASSATSTCSTRCRRPVSRRTPSTWCSRRICTSITPAGLPSGRRMAR